MKKFYSNGVGVKVTQDNRDELRKSLAALRDSVVLVGFPRETNQRQPDPEEKQPANNAQIAYIQDNGAPEANIPARPFMRPAINKATGAAVDLMSAMARSVLRKPGADRVKKGFSAVGQLVVSAIQARLREGIPPPLADATLEARARRGRKGAKAELARRARGERPGTDLAKPLIDTGQLLKAVTYVVRKRGK